MSASSPLDDFKAALSSVARAVTRDAEVEVGFTADAPAQVGKAIKVPTPSRTLPADQVAGARGFADSYALRVKHHREKRDRKGGVWGKRVSMRVDLGGGGDI